jgi:hypothetical protein
MKSQTATDNEAKQQKLAVKKKIKKKNKKKTLGRAKLYYAKICQ